MRTKCERTLRKQRRTATSCFVGAPSRRARLEVTAWRRKEQEKAEIYFSYCACTIPGDLPRSGTGSFNLSNLTSASCWYKSSTWATHRSVKRPVLKWDGKRGSSSDSSLHHRSCDRCVRVLHFSHTCKFNATHTVHIRDLLHAARFSTESPFFLVPLSITALFPITTTTTTKKTQKSFKLDARRSMVDATLFFAKPFDTLRTHNIYSVRSLISKHFSIRSN